MVKLEKRGYNEIYRLYLASAFFFPLIAAVLLDEQDGEVYADDPASPSQAYVEHAFGFSQVFGRPDENFERELERYLLIDKNFKPAKVRLYAPYMPSFLAGNESFRSVRQRFTITGDEFPYRESTGIPSGKPISVGGVDEQNVSLIDEKFGVVQRFWRTPADFIRKSNAVVVNYENEPASICYAAAEADGRAEIDVLTLQEHRNLGMAKCAVINFMNRCFDSSLLPLWDCFTNNSGSMGLCKSVGFLPFKGPYPFFTINKA